MELYINKMFDKGSSSNNTLNSKIYHIPYYPIILSIFILEKSKLLFLNLQLGVAFGQKLIVLVLSLYLPTIISHLQMIMLVLTILDLILLKGIKLI